MRGNYSVKVSITVTIYHFQDPLIQRKNQQVKYVPHRETTEANTVRLECRITRRPIGLLRYAYDTDIYRSLKN